MGRKNLHRFVGKANQNYTMNTEGLPRTQDGCDPRIVENFESPMLVGHMQGTDFDSIKLTLEKN